MERQQEEKHSDRESDQRRIETTVGELICAISDAAREASIKEEDLSTLTHAILMSMLKRG